MSWPAMRLADHCEVITKGTTPTTLGHKFTNAGVPFLRVQNIRDGSVTFDQDTLFIDESTHRILKRSQIRPGDVLVSIAGTIGRAGVVPEDAPPLNCNQAVAIVRLRKDIHRPFLRHWLESLGAQAQMRGATVTGTISNLSLTQLGHLKIPLPPLPEQRRIAEILDKADALRAKRRAALAQLDTLTQSIFRDMFGDPATNPKGWPVTRLEAEIASVRYGTGSPPPYVEDGVPFIRATNVKDGTISAKDLRRISPDDATRLEKCRVETGNLIIVRSGVNTGDCAIVPPEYDGTSAAFDLIIDLPWFNAVFYNFLINSSYGKAHLAPLTRRAAQPHLNAEQVRSLQFISPDQHLKERFAEIVGAIHSVKVRHSDNAGQLDTLFASLQQRAFRGEL